MNELQPAMDGDRQLLELLRADYRGESPLTCRLLIVQISPCWDLTRITTSQQRWKQLE